MAKKLEVDDFDLDHELDFDNFDIDSGLDKEVSKKDRNPVVSVGKGIVGGIRSKFTDPEFLADTVKETLPSEFGTVTKTVNEVVGSAI